MSEKIIRLIFVFSCLIMGVIWAVYVREALESDNPGHNYGSALPWHIIGGLFGGGVGVLVLWLVRFITQDIYEKLAPAMVAIIIAMVFGYALATWLLIWVPDASPNLRLFITVTFVLIFGYVGIYLGLTRASSMQSLLTAVERSKAGKISLKLVDTSVIIDGRIADICDSGFLEGTLLVPRFVLQELQPRRFFRCASPRRVARAGLFSRIYRYQGRHRDHRGRPRNVRDVDSKLVPRAKFRQGSYQRFQSEQGGG